MCGGGGGGGGGGGILGRERRSDEEGTNQTMKVSSLGAVTASS